MSARRADENYESAGSESDESEFGGVDQQSHCGPVHLGFAGEQPIEKGRLHTLRCEYFPLGKVGGAPGWLAPGPLPERSVLQCKVCAKPMRFVLQLYAPQDAADAFHRYLYLFACADGKCCRQNDAANMCALRCQLPKKNRFYSDRGPLDAEKDPPLPWETRDEWKPTDDADAAFAWPLCVVCGCHGPSRCGRCNVARYCGREHQAWHWRRGHKDACGAGATATASTVVDGWLWPCYELSMDEEDDEVVRRALGGMKADEKSEEERMAEFRQYVDALQLTDRVADASLTQSNKGRGNKPDEDDNDEPDVKGVNARPNKQDKVFERFRKVLDAYDQQVVRYQLGGRPLVANNAPIPTPAPCSLCGGERQFEFQATPHLLSVLGIDSTEVGTPADATLDFATVLVYTCVRHCAPPDGGYAVEYCVKQDFDQ